MEDRERLLPVGLRCCSFEVWRRLNLDPARDADLYRDALLLEGYRVGHIALDMLVQIDEDSREFSDKLDLVIVSTSDISMLVEGSYDRLCEGAVQAGLRLCPSLAAPALRLAYGDQPDDEWLYVGMRSVRTSRGVNAIFALTRNREGLWLVGMFDLPQNVWSPDHKFVFALAAPEV